MFATLPGFREFYPDEYRSRLGLFDGWRSTLECCGFQEYDCAVLEPLELYLEKSGNEIAEQLFHFVDKGGRSVALRPEMTPTLARMVGAKANALKRPVKWFHIGDHFRYERMQKGRTRCFTQLNVDILGEAGVIADFESVYSLILTCRRLGLSAEHFYVRLSDRNLWVLVLDVMGVAPQARSGMLGLIDKMERMDVDAVRVALTQMVGDRADGLLSAFRHVFDIRSVDAMEQWFSERSEASREVCDAVRLRLGQWRELLRLLDESGCSGYYELDLSIVRGLAYYTGFVFEAFERGRRSRALAGGGRYDHLVGKLGGPDMHAVGWAMGDVTMLDCLQFHGLVPVRLAPKSFFIACEPDTRAVAMEDLDQLRLAGIPAVFSYRQSGFGKQFKEADQAGCSHVLVYGGDEIANGEVLCKRLVDRREVRIPRSELVVQCLSQA